MPSGDATSAAIRAHFARQGEACGKLGSSFTARLCAVLGEGLQVGEPLGDAVLGWEGDPGADALALRVCGGLQALSWEDARLEALWPPQEVGDAEFADGLMGWIAEEGTRVVPWLASAPQTNEVGRSGVLLGGLLHLADGRDFELLEIGASAGLNLYAERYGYDLGVGHWGGGPVALACDWSGQVPPLDREVRVAARSGCDLAPIDVAVGAERRRLMAYIWPDQAARRARIAAAVDLVAEARPEIVRQGAAAFLAERLAAPAPEGRQRVVMHSIMWQYMPKAEQARTEAVIREAGADGRLDAWLRMEADAEPGSASVMLTRFPGGSEELGRADFHGRWARWS
ncbi:DUF2332 domain-containing protein [Roseobacter sp. HKCCA0434]|uniref:DUF2332 domain-containing protein n=1 Tax=Roseobacter sp. HKCCA0434 TaxID=3079297 RepID=UPI002905C5CA|nr:DUF2332 domain-containing protein [Roseobacter sp. HKCCA0434]